MATLAEASQNYINQIVGPVGDKFVQKYPILGLMPEGTFNKSDGYNHTVTRLTHNRPTKRLYGVDAIDQTDATAGFNLSSSNYKTGESNRSVQLYGTARKSDEINVEDFSFKKFQTDHIANVVKAALEEMNNLNQDWMRLKLAEMSDTKFVLRSTATETYKVSNTSGSPYDIIKVGDGHGTAQGGSATTVVLAASDTQANDFYNGATIVIYQDDSGEAMTTYATVTDYVASTKTITVADWLGGADPGAGYKYAIFTAATLPTDQLESPHVQWLHDLLDAQGASDFGYGKAGSETVYQLVTSPQTKNRLFRDSDEVKAAIQYSSESKKLLSIAGISEAIYGMAPCVDPYNRRFDVNMIEIMPFSNSSATKGQKSEYNYDYQPTSMGGKAVYEMSYFVAPEIFRNESLALPSSIGPATFGSNSYLGNPVFINNKTYNGTNDLGKRGYFNSEWIRCAYPLYSENGITVLHKI